MIIIYKFSGRVIPKGMGKEVSMNAGEMIFLSAWDGIVV